MTHLLRGFDNEMNIYVGNLAYGMTEDELRELFTGYGEVTSASIIMDRTTRQSKGFGFVEMTNDSDAEQAIEGINGTNIKGRNLRVNQAQPRAERGPR